MSPGPGPARCRTPGCGRDIVFGRTATGKMMPMDPGRYDGDDQAANLAVYKDHTGRLNVRVITAAAPLESYEWRAMPHFATCPPLVAAAAARRGDLREDGVIPFPKHRR